MTRSVSAGSEAPAAPVSGKTAAATTAAATNSASPRLQGPPKNEFLTPTLVSIGIEISAVGFLIALLLLTLMIRPGDGGNDGGGAGDGMSGEGSAGEFASTGSGSGMSLEESNTPTDTSDRSEEVTMVEENPGTSDSQANAPAKAGTQLAPPEKKPNVFIVQNLPQHAAAAPPPSPAGGGNGYSDLGDRLREAGARTGDVQISLAWNNGNDLDLHVMTPGNEKISYNQRHSRCGGELDVDMNAGGPASQRPVENVYWPVGRSPSGNFRVLVHHYAQHGGRDPTRFQVTIKVKDKTQSFSGSLQFGDAAKTVHEFSFP